MDNTQDMQSKQNILEIRDLHVRFPGYFGLTSVLNGVNLTIDRGSIFGLVGESGSGKSMTGYSTLRMLKSPGYIEKGEILLNGQDLTHLSEEEMRRNIRGRQISLIPQGTGGNLNPTFKIGKQIMAVLRTHEGTGRKEALAKAEELLHSVGLPEPKKRLKAYPHELSGGMCQRVMIAMGLACHPRLLIADEPTTGLDVTVQAQILDLIAALIEDHGSSCMLITHDLGVVAEVCHYTGVMYAGQVVEYGPTDEIFKRPLHPYTKNLLRATFRVDRKKEIYSIPGSVPDLRALPLGCKFAARCDEILPECTSTEPEAICMDGGRIVKCHRSGGTI